MKKALLLVLFCTMIIPAFCQSDTLTKKRSGKSRNMDLEFSLSYSVVLGDYGKFDTRNSKSGYAANGWLAQLTFDWLGKRDIGLAFQYAYQRNPLLDTASFINPGGTGDTNYRLGPGAWSNHYLMAGPVYLHYFNRISLDIKILAGVLFASSTNFSITDPATQQTTTGTGTGFAYQFSAGLGYKVSTHFALKFNASYLGAIPSLNKKYYTYVQEEMVDPNTGNVYFINVFRGSETTIKKVVSTLNIGIGIIYKF